MTCTELLAKGDTASAARDLPALARIAADLAARVGDPHRDALRDFAHACGAGKHQPGRWRALRDEIALRIEIAGT